MAQGPNGQPFQATPAVMGAYYNPTTNQYFSDNVGRNYEGWQALGMDMSNVPEGATYVDNPFNVNTAGSKTYMDVPTTPAVTIPFPDYGVIGVPTTPTTNEYGFTRIQGPHAQVVMDYYNPTTGQTFSGTGWEMPENSDWRVGTPGVNDLVQQAPTPVVTTPTPIDIQTTPSNIPEILQEASNPVIQETTPINIAEILQQQTPVQETPAPVAIPEISPTFAFAQSLPSTTPQPSNSLFNFETSSQLLNNNNNTINQPYVYGNLGPTSSDYSQWGSRGNPYITYGQNPYIPGQNVPILPQPITPTPSTGGDGDATSPTTDYGDGFSFTGDPYADSFNFSNTMQNSLFGQFPGVLSGLALYNAGINPLNQWFGYGDKYNENWAGSGAAAVGAYGLTPGEQMDMIIDQEAGMWDNPYEQDLWYTGSAALNPNEYELAQEYGWGSPEHLAAIEQTFNFGQADTLAAQSDAAIAQAQADALAAEEAAKQAELDKIAEYQGILDAQFAEQAAVQEGLNAEQISLMNDIANDMQSQYGEFTGGVEGQLEQMAAENAAMFDSYAEYQAWNNSQQEQAAAAQAAAEAAAAQAAAEAAAAEAALQEELDRQAEQFTSGGDSGRGSTSEADLGGSPTTTDDAYDEIGDYASYDDPGDSGGGDGGGGGGGSYIATATTQALGKDGLKVFEDWRDYMAKVYPTFKASYGRYRVTAPKIVSAIDKKENSKELYKEIWDKHLKPIFDLISKDKDSKKAQTDYKSMVRELKNKYLTGDKDAK